MFSPNFDLENKKIETGTYMICRKGKDKINIKKTYNYVGNNIKIINYKMKYEIYTDSDNFFFLPPIFGLK